MREINCILCLSRVISIKQIYIYTYIGEKKKKRILDHNLDFDKISTAIQDRKDNQLSNSELKTMRKRSRLSSRLYTGDQEFLTDFSDEEIQQLKENMNIIKRCAGIVSLKNDYELLEFLNKTEDLRVYIYIYIYRGRET